MSLKSMDCMAGIEGVEPPTCPLGGGRSIQLSYIPADFTVLYGCTKSNYI